VLKATRQDRTASWNSPTPVWTKIVGRLCLEGSKLGSKNNKNNKITALPGSSLLELTATALHVSSAVLVSPCSEHAAASRE
jgi:hypothetical protein